MGDIRLGAIKGFYGSWGSGIATLVIDDDYHGTVRVPCENASTVRAFNAAYGGITPGHNFDVASIRDKRIFYGYDDMGLTLGWFLPEGLDYDGEIRERYNSQFKPQAVRAAKK